MPQPVIKLGRLLEKDIKENAKRMENDEPVQRINLKELMLKAGYSVLSVSSGRKQILSTQYIQEKLLKLEYLGAAAMEGLAISLDKGELSDGNKIKLLQTTESLSALMQGKPTAIVGITGLQELKQALKGVLIVDEDEDVEEGVIE